VELLITYISLINKTFESRRYCHRNSSKTAWIYVTCRQVCCRYCTIRWCRWSRSSSTKRNSKSSKWMNFSIILINKKTHRDNSLPAISCRKTAIMIIENNLVLILEIILCSVTCVCRVSCENEYHFKRH
jgi:hypothetical protein